MPNLISANSTALPAITRYCLYLLLVFTPLARGAVQPWAVYVVHILTLVALAAFILGQALRWQWQWQRTCLDKPIAVLILWLIVTTAFSTHIRTSVWATILCLNHIIVFYLAVNTICQRRHFAVTVKVLSGLAVCLCVIGYLKYTGLNPFAWWEYPELNYPREWISATYGNHNHFAGFLEMVLPLLIGYVLSKYTQKEQGLSMFVIAVLLCALALTLSRGGWVGTFGGLTFLLLLAFWTKLINKTTIIIVAIGAGALALTLFMFSAPIAERVLSPGGRYGYVSLNARLVVWREVLVMIAENPFLGVGAGNFAAVFTQYQPPGLDSRFDMAHNDYLHFIAEVGLPLIPILLWGGFAIIGRVLYKLQSRSRFVRASTLGAAGGVVAIAIHSLFDFNLHIPANAILFAVLLAAVAVPKSVPHPGHAQAVPTAAKDTKK